MNCLVHRCSEAACSEVLLLPFNRMHAHSCFPVLLGVSLLIARGARTNSCKKRRLTANYCVNSHWQYIPALRICESLICTHEGAAATLLKPRWRAQSSETSESKQKRTQMITAAAAATPAGTNTKEQQHWQTHPEKSSRGNATNQKQKNSSSGNTNKRKHKQKTQPPEARLATTRRRFLFSSWSSWKPLWLLNIR